MSSDVEGAIRSGARRGVVPLMLKVAELFMMLVIGVYIAKMGVIAMGINGGEGGISAYLMLVVDVAMTIITLDSLLSVSSRRPKAWKKVVRSAILLVVFNLYYWLGLSDGLSSHVVLNPVLITPAAIIVMALMFTRTVRDYYVPPMEERRPLRDWVRFALFWPLYTAESYRIRYERTRLSQDPVTALRRYSPILSSGEYLGGMGQEVVPPHPGQVRPRE